jgi:NAD+-dependent farnesol dehydrogenase
VRVLVTGGTGYLGSTICRVLIARGHEAVPFARATGGDVRDRAGVSAAARGVDAIIHSAALVSIWRPRAQDFDDINVGGLENVLAAAREHHLARVVYTSSFLAQAPTGRTAPLRANDYQRTKADALIVATRAAEAGAPIVTIIPGVIFGPGLMSEGNLIGRMVSDHLSGRLPGLIGPDRIWSFAWVEDVAAAHVDALERGEAGAIIEAGGHNLPQRAPFEWLQQTRGMKLPRTLPAWAGTAAGYLELGRAHLTGRMPLLTPATVDIFRYDWALTGQPSRSFDEQMSRLAAGH